MDRWNDKIALVTGASAGIGASISQELVNAGLKVVGLARRPELVENISRNLSDSKGKLYALKADVTKEEEILEAFKWTEKNLGPVSILINNAGLCLPIKLTEGATDDFKTIFDTNVMAMCIATKYAVKIMRENEIDGHIININSIAGHKIMPIPNYNVYPASKYAVTALTETLRHELLELKTKIKVSSISPGLVDTSIFEANGINEENTPILKICPRLQPKDVSDAIMYVLSTPPNVQITELTVQPLGELF